ncbi:MAG: hypothetical protein AB1656_02355 [Candidatus Omnitrophota bacterium]
MLDPSLREKLFGAEKQTPSLKAEYERKVKAMIERELTQWERIENMAGIVFGIVTALASAAALVFSAFYDFPNALRLVLGLLFCFCVIGATYSFYILSKGKINLRRDRNIEFTFIWIFVSIIVFVLFIGGAMDRNASAGLYKALMGIFILLIAIMATICRTIELLGVDIKEKLLSLELEIAELKDRPSTPEKTGDSPTSDRLK